ncbi:HNH endonuclease family protein [Pseudomonas wadenswilerensis]
MRRVTRPKNSAPAGLDALDKNGHSERDRARAHHNSTTPPKESFTYKAYKLQAVKNKLAELFHNKCAYCETFYNASAPVDIEHYRPKGSVNEAPGHTGYWWLAMSWDNLLPSCIDCNRRRKQRLVSLSSSLAKLYSPNPGGRGGIRQDHGGKHDSFPIRDTGTRLTAEQYNYTAEEALLLDPTRDDPSEHLRFHVDHTLPISLVLAGRGPGEDSDRGAVSIHTYGLNRLGLVQERTRLLRHLHLLGELVIELGDIIEDLAPLKDLTVQKARKRLQLMQDRLFQEIKGMAADDAPYSVMVKTWLKQYLAHL